MYSLAALAAMHADVRCSNQPDPRFAPVMTGATSDGEQATRGTHTPGCRTFDTPPTFVPVEGPAQAGVDRFERVVDLILDECFFAFGQAVGTCKVLEPDAVIWLRQHYRRKFLFSMSMFGNRWMTDRLRVMQVGHLLGQRAVRYADVLPTIDRDCAIKAAADVERYCTLHAMRRARETWQNEDGTDVTPMIAGYWCVPGIPGSNGGTTGGASDGD